MYHLHQVIKLNTTRKQDKNKSCAQCVALRKERPCVTTAKKPYPKPKPGGEKI